MSEWQPIVGSSKPRREGREKVMGRAQYTEDIAMPGMLHGALVTSPYAHAAIRGYDISAALELPGVEAVVTGDDVGFDRMGPFIKDECAIAKGKVRYVGEIVAAVAATDLETAKRAAGLIEVDYEELPAILSPEEGLADGAVLVHDELSEYVQAMPLESSGNVLSRSEIAEGDVDGAWSQCDVIVEREYFTQAQYHACMEPSAAIAAVDPDGRLTVWSPNQSVFRVQANLAECLAMPMSRIRAISPRVGGGFGARMEPIAQPVAALLAIKSGKTVKVVLTRDQDMEMTRSRHPARIRMKTGAKADGTLVAREAVIDLDAGAYADDSPGVAGICSLFSRGPYHIDNVRLVARAVYTNKLRAGAFRGFGGPQVQWAGEQQIDEIAEKLGVDPIDLRIQNAVQAGRDWMCGTQVDRSDMVECLEKVRAACDWDKKRAAAKSSGVSKDGKRTSIGLAALLHTSGLLTSSAIIRVLEDGTITLNTGAVDIGQGSDTVMVQMCAEALQVPLEQVHLAVADTDASPYNWGAAASRMTYMVGRAVTQAAHATVEQLKKHASDLLECSEDDIELRPGGRLGLVGVPEKELTFGQISGYCHWASGGPVIGTHSLAYDGPRFDPKRAVLKGFPFHIGTWVFGAQVVEIELDERTGYIKPLNVWSVHDIGKAINPQSVEGQIEGGVVQGLGYALCEELVWDDGRLANPSFMDYKLPTVTEVPRSIHSILVENADDTGPFGAKGIGEPPIVCIAPAIGNAVTHATGVRLTTLPMTSERVLTALEADASGG